MNELLDGEISTLNRIRLDNHLKKCGPCASEKASLKKVFNLLEELKYTEGKSISAVTKALTLPAKENSLSMFKKWWLLPSLSSALIIILFFVLFPFNKKTDSIEKGIDYLSKNQNSDGSWGMTGTKKSVSSSSLGLIALLEYKQKYNTCKYDEKILGTVKYLTKAINPSGCISNSNNRITVIYDNSYAIVALSKYLRLNENKEVRNILNASVKATEKMHEQDDSWRLNRFSVSDECIVSANQVMALIKAKEAGIDVNEDIIMSGVKHLERFIKNSALTRKSMESLELDIAAITVLLSNGKEEREQAESILSNSSLFAKYKNPCVYYHGLVFYSYYYDYTRSQTVLNKKGVCKIINQHQKNDGAWASCKDDSFSTASATYFLLKCGKKA